MKRRKFKQSNLKLFLFSVLAFLSVVGIVMGVLALTNPYMFAKSSSLPSKRTLNQTASEKPTIYPTIWVTGSSGNIDPLDWMMGTFLPDKTIPAKKGLNILVDITNNNKITVTGSIAADNVYPIIEFGTVKGTSQGEPYAKALKVAMDYLMAHYHIPWMNMMGYSSGGTGVIYYMIAYSQDKTLPPVRKFASLDGEYNTLKGLLPGETLGNVIASGPQLQTPMYQYIAENYKKIDPSTQVVLMEGLYNVPDQTDSAIPWADTLSIYHLLVDNGNMVGIHFYPTTTTHGYDTKNPYAQAFIKNFFYGDNQK